MIDGGRENSPLTEFGIGMSWNLLLLLSLFSLLPPFLTAQTPILGGGRGRRRRSFNGPGSVISTPIGTLTHIGHPLFRTHVKKPPILTLIIFMPKTIPQQQKAHRPHSAFNKQANPNSKIPSSFEPSQKQNNTPTQKHNHDDRNQTTTTATTTTTSHGIQYWHCQRGATGH